MAYADLDPYLQRRLIARGGPRYCNGASGKRHRIRNPDGTPTDNLMVYLRADRQWFMLKGCRACQNAARRVGAS